MNIKRDVVFCPVYLNKDGAPRTENIPTRMRVMYTGRCVEFFTEYRIDMDKWDELNELVEPRCMNKLTQSAGELNAGLHKYYTESQSTFKEFEMKGAHRNPSSREIHSIEVPTLDKRCRKLIYPKRVWTCYKLSMSSSWSV